MISPRRENTQGGDGLEEDDDDDDDDEEDEEEEGGDAEEEGNAPAGEGSGAAEQELTRAERRELKKAQAAKKQEAEEEDPDLINPNHVEKKLTISDLAAPKELSRRERSVVVFLSAIQLMGFRTKGAEGETGGERSLLEGPPDNLTV